MNAVGYVVSLPAEVITQKSHQKTDQNRDNYFESGRFMPKFIWFVFCSVGYNIAVSDYNSTICCSNYITRGYIPFWFEFSKDFITMSNIY